MKRLLLGLGLVVALCAQVGFNLPGWPPVQPTVASGPPTFTSVDGPYFVAATGCSDANNGLSSGSPWCSLNHAVNCGDVVIFAAGTYTNQFNNFGTVSNCPSTTGGIDGAGGVYFAIALCGGTDLEACKFNNTGAEGLFELKKSNWAVEGMKIVSSGGNRAFDFHETTGTAVIHDFAVVNNVVSNSKQAFGFDDDGSANHNAGNGLDYAFVIGNLVQNAALDTICLAAIDFVAPGEWDTVAGTHLYAYGNIAIANNTSATCTSDMESYMLDTPDAHAYNQQVVFANNISVKATRPALQLTGQNLHTITPTVKIYNNTFFADMTNVGTDCCDGEINLGASGNPTWTVTIQNNIGQTNAATSNGHSIFAATFGGSTWSNLTVGGSGTQNFFKASASACPGGASCDSGHNVAAFNSNTFGTNTYVDAGFNNTTDLLANWLGVPSCTGFITVTQCMGYDPNTATLTSNTVIYDLVPTSTGTSGKGYQLPSTTCAANSDYPSRLKGIVVLHWDGTKITERPDLVSKPCNL